MKISPVGLRNAALVEATSFGDERGYFFRAFCKDTLAAAGIDFEPLQANMSGNAKAGTLRGLHYQVAPSPEAKLIRCVKGSLFDIMVDMDPESPSYRKWFGAELSAENQRALYVPPLMAHGYLALSDDAEAFYLTDAAYAPDCERGLRFDDPAIGVELPLAPTFVSDKDRGWEFLK